ncbi:MAG: selenoneine biosynthesis selenosugar synthase SenB [Terriglobia bacterium]
MKIEIVTPAPPRSRFGNRVTAIRWARILRSLGHRVVLTQAYLNQPCNVLVALHAKRSYPSVRQFHLLHPERPILLALTGTDLYRDLPRSRSARKSLELATRIIVLQPKASERLETRFHGKVRVIYQSSPGSPAKASRLQRTFDVCVIGHLRPVKDPFRPALAARRLPESSRVRILHLGAAMDERMAQRARSEMRANPRYQWVGELPPRRVQRILRQSALCVLPSRMEGGANVISEAVVAGVPVLASRIPGSVGLLGGDYPGYFSVGDTAGLAKLLSRAENDLMFRKGLAACCRDLSPLFDPRREKKAWGDLLQEL